MANIGRYRILEEIGRGGMGVVYKAHDPNLGIDLALKVLRKDRSGNESFVRRFMAEARALGRLDHPEIVRVYNVDRDGEDVYIATEFIAGTPLSVRMKEAAFSPPAIAEFGSRIARALDYAHQKGIVHRDVKPSNILCTADGGFKITDFGIAHIDDPSGADETVAGEILGTPAYMSPEQVLGRPVDGRSDLFSLGIILYEMATGARPFLGEGMTAIFHAIVSTSPLPVCSVNPAVPGQLSDAVMKCLEKSPDARHCDGAALAAAVEEAAPSPPVPDPKSPARMVIHRGVTAAAAALAVLCAALFFLLRSPPSSRKGPGPERPQSQQAALPQGRLTVETTPPGAAILLDGVPRGGTPAALAVPPGKHEMVLRLPGHYRWEAQVELEKGAETPVSVALTPADTE
ncbi:protein kinase [Geomonas sp. RF6]|uniref:serine/threonine-protein kinase n=1 Tax=Geomonas sp. RF6 TaxID=2897342 RepID=UPI001E64DD1E|nr:serine/threonine-protein kinase [Geomonas sp. RF6]UFS70729.1 protein kinase [Geomonas sp. RF6]